MLDAELSSRRGLSIELPATHTARAFWLLLLAVLVEVDDARHLALVIVLDARHVAAGPDFQLSGLLALGNFGVERRPLRARLAALEAEADLLAGAAAVTRGRVDRHAARVAFLVAELVGAGLHDLEVIVAGQAFDAVGARGAHAVFGLGVPRFHFLAVDGPVEQVRTGDVAVGRLGLPFVRLEAQRCARPVNGRAADGLDDPGGKACEVLGHAPVA